MELLRRLKISDNGPLAKVIKPAPTHTVTAHIKQSQEPTVAPPISKLNDPLVSPSLTRVPPTVLPRTSSKVDGDEWSDHYWVLGRKHYQEAQVKAKQSLPPAFEDDEPRFVSPMILFRCDSLIEVMKLITHPEMEDFHNYIADRYRFRTADEYQNILRAFRNTRAIEASNAIHRCEQINEMQSLLDDCRDTTADLLDHLEWL